MFVDRKRWAARHLWNWNEEDKPQSDQPVLCSTFAALILLLPTQDISMRAAKNSMQSSKVCIVFQSSADIIFRYQMFFQIIFSSLGIECDWKRISVFDWFTSLIHYSFMRSLFHPSIISTTYPFWGWGCITGQTYIQATIHSHIHSYGHLRVPN